MINATANLLETADEYREDQNANMIKLEEHQAVQRAQDMLMRQRNLNEEEAYQMLQDMAKKRNMKLTEIANQFIETAKRLTI